MTQREALERIFQKYGEIVRIKGNDVKGMIRPLQYKSAASLNLPAQYDGNLHTLYTGPVSQKLCSGDELKTDAHNYIVIRADTALIGGEELYIWAVLKVLAAGADKEVYLEVDGERVAIIDSYTEQITQQSRVITAWGEQEPVGTVPGRVQYALTLHTVRPADGINLYTLTEFNLIAARAGARIIYSGCRWKSIVSSGGVGNLTSLKMELVAAGRTEEKEAESGGS